MSYYNNMHMSRLKPVEYNPCEKLKSCTMAQEGSEEVTEDIYLSMLPSIIIFVHGVNSEGEWYKRAEENFCQGLNLRLGREEHSGALTPNDYYSAADGHDVINKKSSPNIEKIKAGLFNSPVIPFYWGYQSHPDETEEYDISLRQDDLGNGYWGGGPFQNGTTTLQDMYGIGVQDLIGFIDPQRINPVEGRTVHHCPPRHYMVHAAQRLAFLIDTIRKQPGGYQQTINLVCHSQGNMIGLLSQLMVKTRAADTVLLNQPPYALDYTPYLVLASNNFDFSIPTVGARKRTLQNFAKKIEQGFTSPHPITGKKPFSEKALWNKVKPLIAGKNYDENNQRDNRGKVFLNFCVHDRVIGVSAVEGIGWQGIADDKLLNNMPNFYQRAFAGGEKVGLDTNYYFDFSSVHIDGQFWHPEPERVRFRLSETESGAIFLGSAVFGRPLVALPTSGFLAINYSYNKNEKGGFVPIYNDPKDRRVKVNAPIVNNKIDGVELVVKLKIREKGQEILDAYDQHTENLIKSTSERDLPYLLNDMPKKSWTEVDYIYSPHAQKLMTDIPYQGTFSIKQVEESEEEYRERINKIEGATTDHSDILDHPHYPKIVTNILSYDLAIGINTLYRDREFWVYLHKLADWTQSDPYFNPTLTKQAYDPTAEFNAEGVRDSGALFLTRDSLGEMPEGLDRETIPILGIKKMAQGINRIIVEIGTTADSIQNGVKVGMEEYGKAQVLQGEIALEQGKATIDAIGSGIDSVKSGVKSGMEESRKAQMLNSEIAMAQGKAINEMIEKGLESCGEYADKVQASTVQKMKQLVEAAAAAYSKHSDIDNRQDNGK
ncbi:T6SS effector phospholipase Tle3 domain-containing protein [Pragia fontium]|uniref:T6SS effector phospholipase Tle3 domain-containing protein n=1 Tax=Pragia fontium TaxID=82985 RepID=UPI000F70446C|nr:DUF3274 domain-containing protein [Pragia fontium]VEJ54173.1 Uncharacterised protein [Pragia fontium]